MQDQSTIFYVQDNQEVQVDFHSSSSSIFQLKIGWSMLGVAFS